MVSGYLSPWRALFSNVELLTCRLWRKRSFQGESWVEQVRGWTGQGSAGWTWSSRRPTTPASTTSSTGAIKSSLQTDRNFNHDCRDDKKRKAFQRGGPQKPKVQPAYEKVFLKIFTLHLLFSIQELIEKFHTESKARWQNLTCLLSSSIKSWESNCTSDVKEDKN